MAMRTIRGAVTVEEDARSEVLSKTKEMLKEIIVRNNIEVEDITSVLFTATEDIKSAYPAVAAREPELNIVNASLMCMQEMYVEGSLKRCIRAMVTVDTDKPQGEMEHVYLYGAVVLRPDLAQKNISVAIDGPAGSGKSTVAKLLAKKYGFIYADTGAMYRAVGLYCMEKGIDDDEEIGSLAEQIDIAIDNSEGAQRIYLEGKDVTEKIRTPEIAAWASRVAAIPLVRAALVRLQREIAEKSSVVMDGRDIGTNVLPRAQVKVYLDADVRERAARRCHELEEKGVKADIDKIAREIAKRDENDKNRACNPLTAAADAVIIDTTAMSIEQVEKAVSELIDKEVRA